MIIKIIVTITLLFALLWIYSSLKVSSAADKTIEKERKRKYGIMDKKSR